MKRKIFLIVIAAIIVLAVISWLVLWGMDAYAKRPVTGKLSFNSQKLAAKDYTAGNFIISWKPDNGGTLSITHQSQPAKVLWQSIRGESFVAAAIGTATITESRGLFTIKDNISKVYCDQAIDDMNASPDSVDITGTVTSGTGSVGYKIILRQNNSNDLSMDLTFDDKNINRSFLTCTSSKDEHFFGFGEQFSCFDMKGKRLPIFCSEQGVGRGAQPITAGANLTAGAGGDWHNSYAGVPHYITSRLRSMFLENYEYSIFDMRQEDRVQVQLFSPAMKAHILSGSSPSDLIKTYTAFSGRMRPLPEWITSGAVVGMQGGTDKVRSIYQQLKQQQAPVSAFWLQDWQGQRVTSFGKQLWWNWEADKDRYPGWEQLVSGMGADGVRMMVYVNPFLVDVSEKSNARRNLFKEAEDKGYLVKNRNGGTYMIKGAAFSAGLLDLTNPQACIWIKQVIKDQVIGAGAKGWMSDFGEGLPCDAVLSSGEDAAAYHDKYPEVWARLNREAIDEAGMGDDIVFFSRSGYTRSPGYSTLFWEGDQLVSWDEYDGIKTAVCGLLSSGMSGFSFNHSDIGGYTTINSPLKNYHRSKELLLRWMELNAFSTVFRTHEGNLPDDNVQFYTDNETMAGFNRTARIYAAWDFYRRQLIREAADTGLPVVRHPFIHYPDDSAVYPIWCRQFMVGSEFMVAPVLDEGQASVTLYLPAGEWVHAWSGKKYGESARGSNITVDAPIGKPAVFYCAGSAAGEKFIQNLKQAGVLY
jgi:alpha-glucosidase